MLRSLSLSALALVLSAPAPALAGPRIKDIVDVEGARENQLVGYGLVVGLPNTGDSLRNAPFTRQSLSAMLERLGVNTRNELLNTRNVAAVMVTANLPAFGSMGGRMDVTVSALGDARSLAGGQLLATPLMGADQQVYAVAQGPVAVGGFAAEGDSGSSVTRGVPTAGRIPNGALIEKEVGFDFGAQRELRLALRDPDFTTASRIAQAVNAKMPGTARAMNSGAVLLRLPQGYAGDMVNLVADIESLTVEVDQPARVVIDDSNGVIVLGEDVRVATVAIAQGNLTIAVSEQPVASQPEPFSQGETVVLPQTDIAVEEERGTGLAVVDGGASLKDLVAGLNALGVSPRDMITILQALKAAGALQAEIEVI